ncbi:MAG: flagellar biosynthetic protein FliR [Vicinamibacterales bacterium]|nr:flagellar biosynthetic protein FliR [Vicinamibacterales bacterium]
MTETFPLAALGVLLVRPGALVLATPVFGGSFVPPPVRVALTAILAVLLFPAVAVPDNLSPAGLAVVVAGETVIGVALSLAIRVLVAGAEFAGSVAGFQVGLSYAATVDPATGARNNVVTVLYGSLATVAFLGINGHHDLLRALVRSYDAMPLGSWQLSMVSADTVTRMLGLVFLIGAQLAMPLIVVLLLVEVGIGLASRAAPALHVMTLGLPVRVAVGLLTLAVAVQVVPGAVVRYAPVALEAATRLIWLAR